MVGAAAQLIGHCIVLGDENPSQSIEPYPDEGCVLRYIIYGAKTVGLVCPLNLNAIPYV